jgi:hypothetical protein
MKDRYTEQTMLADAVYLSRCSIGELERSLERLKTAIHPKAPQSASILLKLKALHAELEQERDAHWRNGRLPKLKAVAP